MVYSIYPIFSVLLRSIIASEVEVHLFSLSREFGVLLLAAFIGLLNSLEVDLTLLEESVSE